MIQGMTPGDGVRGSFFDTWGRRRSGRGTSPESDACGNMGGTYSEEDRHRIRGLQKIHR